MNSHTMYLEETHPTGAQTWQCISCPRRFVFRWYVERERFKRISLVEGEHALPHICSMLENIELLVSKDSDSEFNIDLWRELMG